MGLRRGLRNLDRRLIPPLAAGLTRLSGGRRRPLTGTVVVVVAVALLLAGALALRDEPAAPAPETTRVGLTAGEPVASYLAHSRDDLVRLADTGGPVYALVSLSAYLAPARLARVVAGVRTERVYTRVPVGGAAAPVAPVTAHRVPADVTAGMDRLAADRYRIAGDFGRLAASPGPQHAEYVAEQRAYRVQAVAYAEHCSCVFAALVRGRAAALSAVAHRPGVLAVEPARAGARPDRMVVAPPLPEQAAATPTPSVSSPASPTPSEPPPSTAPSGSPSRSGPAPTGTPAVPGPSASDPAPTPPG